MGKTKLHLRKGDRVVILSGKDKGKKGKVISSMPRNNKVVVEGVNLLKKHDRPTRKASQGGIREVEAPFHASNAMVICPSCKSPTRIMSLTEGGGTKNRGCKKCGNALDK